MQLNRLILNMILTPLKVEDAPFEIKGSSDVKSPSQRLTACIYAWFKHEQETGQLTKDAVFEVFRLQKMEALIEFVKKKLDHD
jgi:hypothetical protein